MNNTIHGDFIDGTAILYKKIKDKFVKGLLFEDGTEKFFPHCDFDSFRCGLAVFWDWSKTETERMSYINRKGELLFEPRNIAASEFSEDRALIFNLDKNVTQLIDTSGNVVKEFDDVSDDFHEGVCRVYRVDATSIVTVGFVNRDGEFVIPMEYEFDIEVARNSNSGRYDCNEDLIVMMKDKKFGYITKENKIAIPFEYEAASHFQNGVAFVKKDGAFGLIDKQNNIILPFDYDDYSFGSEGIFLFQKNGKCGIVNLKKEIILRFEYEAMEWISQDYIIVQKEKEGNYGCIDLQGNIVVPFEFDLLLSFEVGLFRFRKDGNSDMGLMDIHCNIIIPNEFVVIKNFEEGLCKLWNYSSEDDGRVVAIADRKGNMLKLDM